MSYTGLGVYQQQPPPRRPSRAPLWIALAAVGVLVVGGGVTAVVVANSGGEQPAPTTSATAEPEWQVVDDAQAGIAYELPPTWTSNGGGASGRIRLSEIHSSQQYECQGRSMIQAQAVSGSIIDDDPEEVAAELADRIATGGYTVNEVPPEVAAPRVSSADEEKVVLSVDVTPKSVSACFAPRGTVSAVALRNGPKVSVFALNVANGGPHAALGLSEDDVERILGSVRLS